MNFNPDQFMQTVVEGEMDTKRQPVPAGEYTSMIDSVTPRVAGDAPILDVYFAIDDPAVKQALGREKITVRQTCWLDLTPEGGLDNGPGKNVDLGRIRAAVGQNGPNAWSPSMLIGQACKVKVTHKPAKDGSGDVYDNVGGVSKL